ncbi:phosphoglycolate phosphatase [Sulfitobacter noctilucae]|uniref:phosphoglycolate phosphatase n=1 Tax=Sulfitobacter noctilucae TaxID=1342302 RepID=UPI000469CF49|nr:phosphoglycolate phosphatase [Sulfitobacter noctilucae]
MTKFETIIFDLDGTLIHSAPDMHAAVNTALSEIGRAPLDLPTITSFVGNGVENLVAKSVAATGDTDEDTMHKVLKRVRGIYDADPCSRTTIYPGVEERLAELQALNIPLGICTNKPNGPAQSICGALKLEPYFDVIAGAEDGMAKKPDPAPLFDVIKRMGGTPASTLYVGDSTVDQQTAQNADVAFALFTGGYLNAPLAGTPPLFTFDDWKTEWPV